MTAGERLELLASIMSSTDGAFVLEELMASFVLDEDPAIAEERGCIDHPYRAYYEAGQRSVVMYLRRLSQLQRVEEQNG